MVLYLTVDITRYQHLYSIYTRDFTALNLELDERLLKLSNESTVFAKFE